MEKKNSVLIMLSILSLSISAFLLCYYNSKEGFVTINNDYAISLDLNKASEVLHKKGGSLQKDEYFNILVAICTFSNLRTKDLELSTTKGDKNAMDNFFKSISTFMCSSKDGVTRCLDSVDDIRKYVKEFLLMFVSSSGQLSFDNNFTEYLDVYDKYMNKAYKFIDQKYVDCITKNTIKIKVNNKIEEYKVANVVWGTYLCFFGKNANLEVKK
ncbi:hypothetical protein NCER_102162 [Vairimorpha ceranae BRL01]|uniref:Uncharacterized protein n=2 Tax=Vairimorpha ceranae TaxID=40302 RepID=C4VBI9_VAIC1|nr:hypothetical protein AAJ76_4500026537 [Vairimorpha ceranae]EEQ81414.1 hypothetical protein NCER_102162 [Vairimorpha ceranae BRL01]KAF5139664.1 hypothetical protein G9O61_00g021820 [Vairimorpha ceranae]KAF5139797.1 hypothetical protein G9O61_00g020480 [Vairimorpha ceranae]KKO74795.1 hypothetical protein AAJ76_4500026537 [Vairimorpha ceranae]